MIATREFWILLSGPQQAKDFEGRAWRCVDGLFVLLSRDPLYGASLSSIDLWTPFILPMGGWASHERSGRGRYNINIQQCQRLFLVAWVESVVGWYG